MTDTTIVALAHYGLMLMIATAIVAVLIGTRPGRAVLAWMDQQEWL